MCFFFLPEWQGGGSCNYCLIFTFAHGSEIYQIESFFFPAVYFAMLKDTIYVFLGCPSIFVSFGQYESNLKLEA